DEDRRPIAEDRLDPLAAVERVIRLERAGELAVLGEQSGERGMVAVVGIPGEEQRQLAAGVLDPEARQLVHQPSSSAPSASISAKASLASRKLSTAAGMPP